VTSVGIGRWAGLLTAIFVSAAFAQDAERLAVCAECHGANGNSRKAGVPSIAGQPKVFLENYLVLTREGLRGSEAMQKLLHGVPDREIVVLAAHFSSLPMVPEDGDAADAALSERGRDVAAANHCANCHRPDFHGQEQMPRLAGQREDFLIEAMLAYRQNRRPGGDTIMAASLYGIPETDLRALAHYLARLR
jgi:cytochrome c553